MGNITATTGIATTAVLAAAADDGSESSAISGKAKITFARDDLRNRRRCKVSF